VRCAVGLTPAPHEVALRDENVEPIDFDTDDDVVGITGFAVHMRRSVTCERLSWLPERRSP
jgi:hypothetical protein